MTADREMEGAILEEARRVLVRNGFSVVTSDLEQGRDVITAENDFFIMALAETAEAAELTHLEALVATHLLGRLSSTSSSKRWDAYLVLLASDLDVDPDEARIVTELEYNTRGARRLVATGVRATAEDLERVLRPFLPLPAPPIGGLGDVVSELLEEMVVNGAERAQAERMIAVFRDRGDLEDV